MRYAMKICILSQQDFSNKHVSEDTVDAFETTLIKDFPECCTKLPLSEFVYKINRKIETTFKVGGYS